MTDWISVKERLPKPGVEVLCCYINPHRRNKPPRMMVGRDPCGLTGRANIYFWCGSWRAVTHWMPMPQPPKEAAHD